VYVFILPTDPQ